MLRSVGRFASRTRGVRLATSGLGLGSLALATSRAFPSFPALPGSWSTVQCEASVPSGIFNDGGRISAILEEVGVMRKSMQTLGGQGAPIDADKKTRLTLTIFASAREIGYSVDSLLDYRVKKELVSDEVYKQVLAIHRSVKEIASRIGQTGDIELFDELDKAITALRSLYAK